MIIGWVRADYTWVREHTTQTNTPPVTPVGPGVVLITDDVLLFTSWFFQNSAAAQPIAAGELSTSWRMNLDLIDLVSSRACYQGRSLALSPIRWFASSLYSAKPSHFSRFSV